ncbi:hypothetical protein O7614_26565 [Micromonospora sp. WMMD961]|uniref:hypothetical protein n=1 Tax=Micromonospora sp. WMMD961 TaxID=3016100 RepID=UPI0024164A6E|nr:hypothetical protein [Micromonospora sp. WMMD961]MDG4783228.1 hypothetical protein [Micromonospora sp. WMMD961]
MGFQFAKPSSFSGGTFFRVSDHMTDLALLVEPKRIQKGVSNTYNGKTTLRDEVTADVTIFANSEALEKGEPSEVIKDAKFVHGMLTSTLEQVMGGAMVGILRRIPTANGSGYVFRDVAPEVESQVGDYYQKRESAVADALASGAMPSFE